MSPVTPHTRTHTTSPTCAQSGLEVGAGDADSELSLSLVRAAALLNGLAGGSSSSSDSHDLQADEAAICAELAELGPEAATACWVLTATASDDGAILALCQAFARHAPTAAQCLRPLWQALLQAGRYPLLPVIVRTALPPLLQVLSHAYAQAIIPPQAAALARVSGIVQSVEALCLGGGHLPELYQASLPLLLAALDTVEAQHKGLRRGEKCSYAQTELYGIVQCLLLLHSGLGESNAQALARLEGKQSHVQTHTDTHTRARSTPHARVHPIAPHRLRVAAEASDAG